MTALDVLWVGLGGGLGSLLRWWVGRVVGERWRGEFPFGTLLINISGAFPMGYLSVLFAVDWRTRHGTALTALCLIGIMGGMSTFSSFVYGSVVLMHASIPRAVVASVYVVVSLALGYLAIIAGDKLGGQARRPVAAAATDSEARVV
jgi:fluoride exporter